MKEINYELHDEEHNNKVEKTNQKQLDKDQDQDQEQSEQSDQEQSDEDSLIEGGNQENIPIDLSENEIYRGICTLLEDEEGNNILEYISLLHTELIGINKSLENLKLIKNDIKRIADCAELYLKGGDKSLGKDEIKKVIKKKQSV
jgi:hypothetical protein